MSAIILDPKVKTERKRFGVGDALHVVRCNHCRQPVLFENRHAHAAQCRRRRQKEKLEALNLTKDGKALYAVAATRFKNGQWNAPEILYAHARGPGEASRIALAGEPEPMKTIEVGLAIGWFQHEKTGIITG